MGGRPRPPVAGSPEAKQAAIDHAAEKAASNPATA
jgi:monovalent cation:H+ antiporter-2, CPA2 family